MMNEFPHDTSSPPGESFPDDRAACRALLVWMQTGAAAIKDQIAARNLACQAGRTRMDPDWFPRARTALRHKRREIAELQAHMKSLPGSFRDRRSPLKDCIIETVRPDYGDDEWRPVLDQAHRLLDTHGAR